MSTATSAPQAAVRPFGWRDKIGYLFGDFGNDFTFMLQMMFFMVFYTDIMGVDAKHVGTLFLVARLVDAFTDVGMGRLADVMRPTKNGRFRPWILRMSVPVALASTMMYMPFVVDASYGARVTYMCITYFLWGSVFYTSINIPYGSMAAVISEDPEHRASLSVWRSLGANLAYLIISAFLPAFVLVDNKLDAGRMVIASIACGVFAVICYMLCYTNVQERVQVPAKVKGESPSFGKMLGTLATSRPLIALVCGALVFLIGSQVASTTTAYLWKDYFQAGNLMSPAQMVSIAPVFLLAPFAAKMAARFGKKEIIAASLALSAVICLLAWIFKITSPMVFIVIFLFISIGVGLYNVLIWAVVVDVLDHQDVVTGERDDGTVYAIYSWSRKLGQAVSGYIVGWIVSFIGYDSAAAKEGVAQSAQVLDGIYTLYLLVPGALYAVTALIMWFWFPLTRKKVEENTAVIRARQAENA